MVEETKTPEVPEKPEFEKKLDEMRAENQRLEKNISELKELKAIDALNGKSFGAPQEAVEKKETPQEYAKRLREELKTGKLK